MNRSLFILLFTLIWAESSVNVTVDRRSINEGDSITLTVKASDADDAPNVRLPKMQDWKVASGPNSSKSSSVQFVNGRMTSTSTHELTWTLLPLNSGRLEIPAFSIRVDGQNYKSTPITITVHKRGRGSQSKANFFIEAEVDNFNPYRGEQITLTYTLYTQVDVSSFDDELPKFKGFWTEELFAPKNLKLREVQKNGVRYHSATIKKLALFPTRSGEIVINPMTAVIGVRESGQRRWNDFSLFGPPSKKYSLSTNKVTLDVQPLPENEKGRESAVVGNWNIRSTITSTDVKQDDAVTYRIIITGSGNLQSVDVSSMNFPNELEVFEPETTEKENPLRDKIGGEKVFEWVLIPRFAGDIYIPRMDFTYFDPVQEKWVTKSTPRYKLKVSPNEKVAAITSGLSKEEIALVGEDIRFMDDSEPKWRSRGDVIFSTTALSLLLLAGVVFAIPFARDLNRERLDASSGSRRARQALKTSLHELAEAPVTAEDIYLQIHRAVIIFINEKTCGKDADYSIDEIRGIFSSHNAEEHSAELGEILSRGESVRFSPLSSKDAHADIENLKNVLRLADNDWR